MWIQLSNPSKNWGFQFVKILLVIIDSTNTPHTDTQKERQRDREILSQTMLFIKIISKITSIN